MARQVMEQIIATGRVSRGWLGVSARDVIHETTGAAAGAQCGSRSTVPCVARKPRT